LVAPAATSVVQSPPAGVPRRLAAVAGGAGAAGALLLAAPRSGIGVPLAALVASLVLRAVPGRRLDAPGLAMWVLALALTAVAALRASGWLVALCLLVAAALVALAVTRARTWRAVLLALPVLAAYATRGVPWAGRAAANRPRPPGLGAWGRGAGLGLGAAVVVAGLLASADPAYADLLSALVPVDAGSLTVRVVAGLGTAVAVLGVGAALLAPARWAPPPAARVSAHRGEWALPLALVGTVLVLWVAVQAATLFGLTDPALTAAGDTYASRVHQGFGQLVTVTLVLLALLTWSSRRAGEAGRPLFGPLGGALVALGLVVVASALQRMWQYDQAYGWTVLRFAAAATEIWLGWVLVGCAAAWLLRRTRALAVAVPVSGAVWLLVIALAGPDAVVARWDVDRYRQTGRIDPYYLADLSEDAVPALADLPEPVRSCVLAARAPVPDDDPWYGWNLARSRAAAVPGVVVGSLAVGAVSPRWTPTASSCPP
jgi:hypothetical protein